MRLLGTRLESGCRQPPRSGASTLLWTANLRRKDALGELPDLRTRRAAIAPKVILLRMPSKTIFGSYRYSQNPQINLEFFMHAQIHHEAAARQPACDHRAQPGTTGLKPGTTGRDALPLHRKNRRTPPK